MLPLGNLNYDRYTNKELLTTNYYNLNQSAEKMLQPTSGQVQHVSVKFMYNNNPGYVVMRVSGSVHAVDH